MGNSSFEQEHFKTGYLNVFPNERGTYSIYNKLKLFILFGWEYLKNHHNYRWSIFNEYLHGAFAYFFETLQKPSNVEALGFYDYIYWTEREVVSTIRNELYWKSAPDTIATWRIADAAYPLIDYIYLKLVGFNEFDEYYCKLIREGQISRDEALKKCMKDHAPRTPSINRTLEELDVKKEQLDEVLKKYRVPLFKKILNREKKASI